MFFYFHGFRLSLCLFGGKDVPLGHCPSKACQHVISCIRDEEAQESILASINPGLDSPGSLLQILSFNDWVKLMACLDKDKNEGIALIRDFTPQIPILTKALQSELTKFAAQGSDISNHLWKLCGLDPSFISTPATPIVPSSGNIFNRDPAALEAIRNFQNDMCTLTADSRLLEMVPKVSKVYPFLPPR